MNRTALNSGSLNGASNLSWVLASVAITASAAVNAVAVRQYDAFSTYAAGASIVANATNTKIGEANLEATGSLYPVPVVIHAGTSQITGSGEVQSYVLSYVNGVVSISGSSSITAIPASTLGTASLSANATVAATATKIQPGSSAFVASGNVTISVAPLVTRYVNATIAGSGSVRPETRINGIWETYAAPKGTVSIVADAIAYTMQGADLSCTSILQPVITLEQAAKASLYSNSVVMMVEPLITQPSVAYLLVSAAITADAARMPQGVVSLLGSATVQANTKQQYAAKAEPVSTAALVATGTVTQFAETGISSSSDVLPNALKTAYATATIDHSHTIEATAWLALSGAANVVNMVTVSAVGTQLFYGFSNITGSVENTASAYLTVYPEAAVIATVDHNIEATRVAMGDSNIYSIADVASAITYVHMGVSNIDGSVVLNTNPIANPESIDPESRIFYVAARQTDFERPFIETEFRRAA